MLNGILALFLVLCVVAVFESQQPADRQPTPTPTPHSHREHRHHAIQRQATHEATPSSRRYDRATVERVVDGDTVRTSLGTVRVLAIDTPEVYFHRECGGPEASAAMKRLLAPGDSIRLHPDSGEPDKDKYGRLLRYIYKTRPGGDDLGQELVREGWAEVYRAFPTSKTSSYLQTQATAKRAGRGVWGLCGAFES